MSAIDRLLERLQTGWQPTSDAIDADVPQRTLYEWQHWKRSGNLLGYPSDEAGWREVDVLVIDPGQAWALCADGFWWLSNVRDDLLHRLRSGWTPSPESLPLIDPGIEQHTLTDWYFLYRPRSIREPKLLRIVGDLDGDPATTEMTDVILWMDAGQAWALCRDGFYWLDGPEKPRLGHEDRRR
jgi:hypothetical protein